LPWVMLGLRAAPKEEAKILAAEAGLGVQLLLPGQPLAEERYVEKHSVIDSTVRLFADVVAGRPGREYVYIKLGQCKCPLADTYGGPYKVIERGEKAVLLQMGERQEWGAPGRLKLHTGAALVNPAQPPKRGCPPKAPVDRS